MKNATNKPEKEHEPQTAAVCIHASTKQCNHMLKVRAEGFLLNLEQHNARRGEYYDRVTLNGKIGDCQNFSRAIMYINKPCKKNV